MALRRNILIFHHGALGDFIVTWPLALGLSRVFAQSRVFYVASGQKGALAEKTLRIESADVEGGWHQLFSADPQLPERAEKLLAGAQSVLSFVSNGDDQWAQNVRRLNPDAQLICLHTIPPAEFPGHVTEFLLGQLTPWPIVEAAMGQMLQSIAGRGLGLPLAAGGPVVIHPGAGSGKKCWPVEHFVELARLLKEAGRSVRIVLGEVETDTWPAGQTEAVMRSAEVKQPASLLELLNCLSGASAFVGNDSGPGHLAGILGIPTVSIFGPKDPAQWKPLGPKVRVMRGEWNRITPDDVFEAIAQ